MKADIEKMLKLSEDSSRMGGMNDALSFMVGSVREKYGFGNIRELSDDELENVAGGKVIIPENLIKKLNEGKNGNA